MKMLNTVLGSALILASTACSSGGSAVDIGESRTGQKLEDYAAVWEGYAEAYKFADGSDKVRISLDVEGNGTLEIGDSAAIPPATDPNVGYPPSFNGDNEGIDPLVRLFPGASYPIKMASVASARISFSVNPMAIEHDWCALQTPYPATLGFGGSSQIQYICVLGGGDGSSASPGQCVVSDGTSKVPVDCNKLTLCSHVACACTDSACTENEDPALTGPNTELDAALADSGNSLVGTLLTGISPQARVNVRLTRQ